MGESGIVRTIDGIGYRKTAFLSGITGQDAAYLAKLLLNKGYRVIGGARRSAERSFWRLEKLGIKDKIEIVDFELSDQYNIYQTIKDIKPDEFYNLAAMSFVGASFKQPYSTMMVNGMAVLHMLEAIRQESPHTKFYQASTSEMFGEVVETPQNEDTPFRPQSFYAVAKLNAYWLTCLYREAYNIFACNGILFNHEGPLRGGEFVTKKITDYVKQGNFDEPLKLGNIKSKRDWGNAEDYVEAMYLMMQQEKPDDFVISTNEQISVETFAERAFAHSGIDLYWDKDGAFDRMGKKYIDIDPKLYRPSDVNTLQGDYSKAERVLQWKPKTKINDLIKSMLEDKDTTI